MKAWKLIWLLLKYPTRLNRPVDMVIDFEEKGQWEARLGGYAWCPRQKRWKLVNEGF